MFKSAHFISLAVLAAVLAGCGEPAPRPEPPAPKPPVPPSPELPMTAAKAREIIGDLPLACRELATLKMDMVLCDERRGREADHEALRTELRDLRWNLQQQPDTAGAQCHQMQEDLRKQPKPQVCWDLGLGY